MAKKQPVIHMFGNDQFPRRLWIVKDAPFSWIKERFKGINGDELEEVDPDCARAATFADVEHLASREFGILIVIFNGRPLGVNECAHEATHFAMELYRAMGESISVEQQEVMAYLVGWAADCIHQVVTNKYKPTFDGSRELQE